MLGSKKIYTVGEFWNTGACHDPLHGFDRKFHILRQNHKECRFMGFTWPQIQSFLDFINGFAMREDETPRSFFNDFYLFLESLIWKKCQDFLRFMELFSHALKSMEARYRYGEIMQEVWYSQGMELVEALY